MLQFKKVFLYSVLMLTLVLSACSSSSSSSGGEDGVVNIGFTGPLSGPAAYYGENALSGLEMAVEEINENGGFEVDGKKHTLNLVSLDDKYLPNEAGSNAKRLVQENDTPIVYVPHSGGIFATQVFNQQDKFIIGAYSSEPAITEQGNPLTLRIPPKYSSYIEPFSKYQMERFGKKIAMLPTATQYGKDWAALLEPGWKELGGEVVYKGSIDFSKDTDYFTIVTNALKKNPDVLFVGGPSEPTALVMKQARDLGFEGGFLIMDQAKLDEIQAVLGGAELTEGSVGVLPLINSKYEGNEKFINDYIEKHEKNPGSEAGYHYLSVYLFVEAMKAAGTVDDVDKIMAHVQEGLDNVPDDKKIYDITEIDKQGGLETYLRMGVVEDGEIVEKSVEE
ncbi:ABC transporter substrate-binding protein [Bacillus seohaeanensis]|jgi:branched-chain amino acid transport system substrate-binding protein|uniref:ABC transporter substrate-binding protein n=1 Tax=Bacillus seohaeanensis TaxID=284580 RepID=A0ABW5RU57_9BACI